MTFQYALRLLLLQAALNSDSSSRDVGRGSIYCGGKILGMGGISHCNWKTQHF